MWGGNWRVKTPVSFEIVTKTLASVTSDVAFGVDVTAVPSKKGPFSGWRSIADLHFELQE